jgi:glutamyl-Q tRNA(Asp) synthetase
LIVTRFAPSPTGRLHLGHAHAALFAWRAARAAGGAFLLRIEDIDPTRCRPDYTDAIVQDLRWLGLDWDGPVRHQSAHMAEYRAALATLAARNLVYPCFCTRADIAAAAAAPHPAAPGPLRDPYGAPLYPGTCRARPDAAARAAAGTPHALRLDTARALASLAAPLGFTDRAAGQIACAPARFGDPVLARKDAPASYHLCATHDDAVQGVTLVTRGADLLPATDLHRLLQALLGWPQPAYHHHHLLTGPDGRRLSKRDGAITIAALRNAGHSPAAVARMAGFAPAC